MAAIIFGLNLRLGTEAPERSTTGSSFKSKSDLPETAYIVDNLRVWDCPGIG